jgi:uncharacterized repeat protein (TIGR03803 family)
MAGVLLARCGGSQPPISAPGAMPQTSAITTGSSSTNYKVVYSFGGGSDGSNPDAGLVDVGGTLYGTTFAGGSYSCTFYHTSGCGTVFSVTLSGTEKVLHTFGAYGDGSNPEAGLIDVRGTLYGTTQFGGYACYNPSCGTVFSITPSGAEKVLHSFGGAPDGAYPFAGLIDVKGKLYGTTANGGTGTCYSPYSVCGMIFTITTRGTERYLYSFNAHHDGAYPRAGLTDVGRMLYGTTTYGGRRHYGTVFRITLGGKEKVLHTFGAASDGASPYAGLIELNGMLYGTTGSGGAYLCPVSNEGCGTVFSITPGGIEKVIHSFGKGTDGKNPFASVVEQNGELYGTTLFGGTHGWGTVFSITPGGREKVLHSFDGPDGPDGAEPFAGLIDVNGTLYGTTDEGGTYGYGTVFALTP